MNRLERRRGLSDLIDRSIGAASKDPELQWIYLYSDENLDILPDLLAPTCGCSVCGSVWISIESVGIGLSVIPLGLGLSREGKTLKATLTDQYVKAVRLICFMGHTEEHHRRIDWSDVFPMTGALAFALAASAYLFTKEEK